MKRAEQQMFSNTNRRARTQTGRGAVANAIECLESRCYLSISFGSVNTSSAIPATNGVIFAADFNRDGNNDLLINTTPNGGVPGQTTEILFGNGDGTFISSEAGPSGPAGFNYQVTDVVGDVNGDGHPDIIQLATKEINATTFDTEIISYISHSNGTFTASGAVTVPVTTAPRPNSIAVADLNGDGKSDVLLDFDPPAGTTGDTFQVMLSPGDGDGNFAVGNSYTADVGPSNSVVELVTGNFFNHNRTDIVAVAAFNTVFDIGFGFGGVITGGGAAVRMFENNGNGTLTQVNDDLTLGSTGTPFVAAGDFTGDGTADLAFVSQSASEPTLDIEVFQGVGDGTFNPLTAYDITQPIGSFKGIAAADFNGDGKMDLLETTQNVVNANPSQPYQANVFLSNSDGTFQAPVAAIGSSPLTVGGFQGIDLNRDGKADIVAIASNGVDYVENAIENASATNIGSVDAANMNEISGWAYDPSDPTASISVEIIISGGPTQIFAANEPRSDLIGALGSADHAYNYGTPMLTQGAHTFTAFAIERNGAKVPIGTGTLDSQNSLFDEHYYLQQNPDVAAAVASGVIATGYDHYIRYGQYEGRSPSPFWNEQDYLQANPDVAAAVAAKTVSSGFMHYYLYGQYEGRGGLLYFNSAYYLGTYSDVASAVQSGALPSAYEHFVDFGQYEGRSPMLYFSQAVYEAHNPSVAAESTGVLFTSTYDQYLEVGQFEGLIASNFYNEQTYLADNPDVAAAVRAGIFPDGLQHWLKYGQYEGRRAV